jgi:hypothetical protein
VRSLLRFSMAFFFLRVFSFSSFDADCLFAKRTKGAGFRAPIGVRC